jgi:hypothetical protein
MSDRKGIVQRLPEFPQSILAGPCFILLSLDALGLLGCLESVQELCYSVQLCFGLRVVSLV